MLAYDAGLNPTPVRDDGSKIPAAREWGKLAAQRRTRTKTEDAFRSQQGLCILTGNTWNIDGTLSPLKLEMLEADSGEAGERLLARIADHPVAGPAMARVRAGYEERTPGGGLHWPYRCGEIAGNLKLAVRPKLDPERRKLEDGSPDPKDTVKTELETRGVGGQFVAAPSGHNTHTSGKSYVLLQGGFDQIATVTPEERQAIHEVARSLDDRPKQSRQQHRNQERRERKPPSDGRATTQRPGDEYNRTKTWAELLVPASWTKVRTDDAGISYWRRPGATTDSHDATTNADVTDRLYVHSSSIEGLEAGRYYTRFEYFAHVEHGGDFKAAAAALREQGFGKGPKAEPTERRTLRFETIEELRQRPRPAWLIRGILRQGSLAMLVGDFGTYKSFVALAWALSVGSGRPWAGNPVTQGAVALIEAEGAGGLVDRCDAWGEHEGCRLPGNVHVLAESLDLAGDNEALLEALAEIEGLVLVVVDTVARTFAGNENLQEDANAYVRAADRIREATGAAVLLIHHNNKMGEYRGSTVIPAALDTMVGTDRTAKGVALSCLKMKDAAPFDPIQLEKKVVVLGDQPNLLEDSPIDLDQRTSLVFLPIEVQATQQSPSDPFKPSERKVLQALVDAPQTWLAWTRWRDLVKVSQSTFSEAVTALLEGLYVEKEDSGKASYFRATHLGRATLAGDPPEPFASPTEPDRGDAGETGHEAREEAEAA